MEPDFEKTIPIQSPHQPPHLKVVVSNEKGTTKSTPEGLKVLSDIKEEINREKITLPDGVTFPSKEFYLGVAFRVTSAIEKGILNKTDAQSILDTIDKEIVASVNERRGEEKPFSLQVASLK